MTNFLSIISIIAATFYDFFGLNKQVFVINKNNYESPPKTTNLINFYCKNSLCENSCSNYLKIFEQIQTELNLHNLEEFGVKSDIYKFGIIVDEDYIFEKEKIQDFPSLVLKKNGCDNRFEGNIKNIDEVAFWLKKRIFYLQYAYFR